MRMVFLGTGGGRHVMASQVRKSGGLFFDLDKIKFIVDPGPGSLVHAVALGLHPEKWDGLVLSHFHIDHSTDANVLLDGMKEPFLIAEEHCLPSYKSKKGEMPFRCIAPYYMNKVKIYSAKAGDKFSISGAEFTAIRADHYDPAIGFRITSEGLDVGYTSDGTYYSGMGKKYEGCKVLIANVLVPKGQAVERRKHMSVDNVIAMLKSMEQKPQLVVLSHLSFWMMRSNLWKQEKIIKDATGVEVVHPEDFATLDLKTLKMEKHREGKGKI